MLTGYMTVEKKSNRNNKKMEVFILDRFVQKTGPVKRLAIIDVVDIKQRTAKGAWTGPQRYKEVPPLEMSW